MASLGMVFEDYPNEVVCFVTDPKTGIQRRSKWPPTISEIVEACDQHVAYLKQCERFKTWGDRNEPALLEGPMAEKPSLDELKAKYGPNWGLGADKPKDVTPQAPSAEQLAHHYQHYGLGFKPKQSDDAA